MGEFKLAAVKCECDKQIQKTKKSRAFQSL